MLNVEGTDIQVTSWVSYSGKTGSSGATGSLVNLVTAGLTAPPNWEAARDAIAVTNRGALRQTRTSRTSEIPSEPSLSCYLDVRLTLVAWWPVINWHSLLAVLCM